jgi:hypothetical protein
MFFFSFEYLSITPMPDKASVGPVAYVIKGS